MQINLDGNEKHLSWGDLPLVTKFPVVGMNMFFITSSYLPCILTGRTTHKLTIDFWFFGTAFGVGPTISVEICSAWLTTCKSKSRIRFICRFLFQSFGLKSIYWPDCSNQRSAPTLVLRDTFSEKPLTNGRFCTVSNQKIHWMPLPRPWPLLQPSTFPREG